MSNVVSLEEYKQKAIEKELLVRKRDPITISRGESFPDRTDRIRNSMERINELLKALKKASEHEK